MTHHPSSNSDTVTEWVNLNITHHPSSPVPWHGTNHHSRCRKQFPCFLLFYEVEIIIKTIKMTNARGHKFTLISLILNMTCQQCANWYATFESIFVHLINCNTTTPRLSPISEIYFIYQSLIRHPFSQIYWSNITSRSDKWIFGYFQRKIS